MPTNPVKSRVYGTSGNWKTGRAYPNIAIIDMPGVYISYQ